jgi:hypothetical protein
MISGTKNSPPSAVVLGGAYYSQHFFWVKPSKDKTPVAVGNATEVHDLQRGVDVAKTVIISQQAVHAA